MVETEFSICTILLQYSMLSKRIETGRKICSIIALDINNLYTNVPSNTAVDIIKNMLQKHIVR
jgi:hypothetical protein